MLFCSDELIAVILEVIETVRSSHRLSGSITHNRQVLQGIQKDSQSVGKYNTNILY